jgi:arylsulfatase
LVILLDDVGFGQADTFGGDIRTPTLTRVAQQGIAYNTFHTTALCSPTRAALLTGRNHHRVGSGTIAERAVDWDGYVGVIPRSAATFPEVLRHYGYSTAAFGKWHNTPATETTAMGPFDRWPTGYGFQYFYGFIAGETSQYEPRLFENNNAIEPPHDPAYHLSEDLADRAIQWLRRRQAFAPDRPFMMYWAPGAAHGPHHVSQAWADRYRGRFDDGWDAMRERVFTRQKSMGWIPPDTRLTPREASMVSWDSIPENQRAFQRRLMEVFAGFVEHVDVQAGRLVDEIERLGLRENTIIVYIFGDNGASAEGQEGTVSELLAQNGIPNTIEQQLVALDQLGGLPALGSAAVDNMYHAGWAWGGNTPFRHTKVVASHLGGTRNPLAISWPARIRPDARPRPQFHHVNDIAPTIYEILGITPPETVNGVPQDPIDGTSMVYSFAAPDAPDRKVEQYFENGGSRALWRGGWMASAFGPYTPWRASASTADWDPGRERWELYDLRRDFSQAEDLAAREPQRLASLQQQFLAVARENRVFPIGAGNWLRLHPEDRITTPYTQWRFGPETVRMPEFTAPGLGRESSRVTIDADVPADAAGVLYALGGASGGVTLYMDGGRLVYEYNMMIIERYEARSAMVIPPGRHRIEVETRFTTQRPIGPAEVTLRVDGAEVARVTVARTVPAAFTASETLDVGRDLGSPVSRAYAERRPFAFNGTLHEMRVELMR